MRKRYLALSCGNAELPVGGGEGSAYALVDAAIDRHPTEKCACYAHTTCTGHYCCIGQRHWSMQAATAFVFNRVPRVLTPSGQPATTDVWVLSKQPDAQLEAWHVTPAPFPVSREAPPTRCGAHG